MNEELRAAAEAVLRRHANLRACFYHDGLSRPVQVIVPEVALPWRELDLSEFEERGSARSSWPGS